MVLLSLGRLPSSNFKNEYQMTLLVIDHESGFKALHPNDSSEKESKTKSRSVVIVVIVVEITTLE